MLSTWMQNVDSDCVLTKPTVICNNIIINIKYNIIRLFIFSDKTMECEIVNMNI